MHGQRGRRRDEGAGEGEGGPNGAIHRDIIQKKESTIKAGKGVGVGM
jgi:hypothetical protein